MKVQEYVSQGSDDENVHFSYVNYHVVTLDKLKHGRFRQRCGNNVSTSMTFSRYLMRVHGHVRTPHESKRSVQSFMNLEFPMYNYMEKNKTGRFQNQEVLSLVFVSVEEQTFFDGNFRRSSFDRSCTISVTQYTTNWINRPFPNVRYVSTSDGQR